MTFSSTSPSVGTARIHWSAFPASLREQFRLAAWVLLNFPVPDTLLARKTRMRSHLSAQRNYVTIWSWRSFAVWLDERGITELAAVTTEILADYSIHLTTIRKLARNTVVSHLGALTRLHAHAPLLPATARIDTPPWETGDANEYLSSATPTGENATEPISPATMGPLLSWALRFVEDFSTDILAGHVENQRLRTIATAAEQRHSSGGATALRAYLDYLESTGKPLPAGSREGKPTVARNYIAGITGCPATTVESVLRQPKWQRYLTQNPGPCPLDVAITATIDEQPWTHDIDHFQIGSLLAHLNTACFIVIAYLTGMRPSEVLALRAGCCPEPAPATDRDGSATRRHLIRARHYKTAYDEDGNHLSDGLLRPAPWVAVPQVVAAIRILERQAAPTGLLFPTNDTGRPGRSVTYATMGRRIDEFVTWVNSRTGEATIPPDPHGRIGTRRFRRTLAWHIARQPGGLVALAVQYGHMRTLISESYAARQREGIHELLDLETARAVADHLADVHDSLQAGHGVSGPAARRLIDAAHQQHQRFAGAILTRRQAKALLADPTLTVFGNAAAYLTCSYDPVKALCNPDNGSTSRPGAPSLDRCQSCCPNIARTDRDAIQLRAKAKHLQQQADSPITPGPLAQRLRHRALTLSELADTHDRSKITSHLEEEDLG
ncbi:site-specific integrase [Mycobacterium branderi]|nr:integrase [Mycobacterium branderi]